MNRFLTCTAVGLFLGLSPALAEPQLPSDEAQTPPAVNAAVANSRGDARCRAAIRSCGFGTALGSGRADSPATLRKSTPAPHAAGRYRSAPGAVVAGSAIH